MGSGISRAEQLAVPLNAASFEATQLVVSGTAKAVGATETAFRAAPEFAASASPAFSASITEGARSFIRDVGRTLVESPSLMALAMAALPGLFGLLVLTGGGVRVGYRQAKADLVMHRHGLAQFARMGPIGVVRSESLVSVRLRASHMPHPDSQTNPGASRLKLIC